MIAHGFALFDTAIGRCAIAWSGRGILAVQLPEGGRAENAQASHPALSAGARSAAAARRRARPRWRAAVPSPRLRGYAHDCAGRDALVRRDRGAARRASFGACRGTGARQKSVCDPGAVPSRARGRRQARRGFRERRSCDQAPPARDRNRAEQRRARAAVVIASAAVPKRRTPADRLRLSNCSTFGPQIESEKCRPRPYFDADRSRAGRGVGR